MYAMHISVSVLMPNRVVDVLSVLCVYRRFPANRAARGQEGVRRGE